VFNRDESNYYINAINAI